MSYLEIFVMGLAVVFLLVFLFFCMPVLCGILALLLMLVMLAYMFGVLFTFVDKVFVLDDFSMAESISSFFYTWSGSFVIME